MALHAKNTLGGAGVSQILNFLLAVSAFEAAGAEGLFTGEDGKIFNLVATGTAAVGAVVADQ